jgi:hypothetical protein
MASYRVPLPLVSALLLFAGCTTTEQVYSGPRLPLEEGAVLRETRLRDADERALEHWEGFPVDPSIFVRTINGQAVQVYASEFRLQPGTYELDVVGRTHHDYRDAELAPRKLVFEAKPGGEYELRGKMTGVGRDYIVSVWDLAERKEVARTR